MRRIQTVTGEKDPEELGFCQCHEHLMLSRGVSWEIDPNLCINDISKSTREVRRLKRLGGSTVVDAQPVGCNRMEEALVEIAEQTGLHIIASTGFHKLYFYPENHWIHTWTQEELTRLFLFELQKGMYTCTEKKKPKNFITARAGIVKSALDQENLSPRYRKLFTAAAKAALETGVPLMVHIEKDSDPRTLLRFLLDQGLPPEQMIFCHMDRAIPDLDIHRQVLSQGIFLEYDTIGRFRYHSDEEEIRIFQEMLEGGFENQLLFSLDTTRARLKTYQPDAIGLDYLLTTFVPLMQAAGITETQIQKISHHNFVRVFTGI